MIDAVTKEIAFPTIATSVGNIHTKVGNSSEVLPSGWGSLLESNPAVPAAIRKSSPWKRSSSWDLLIWWKEKHLPKN